MYIVQVGCCGAYGEEDYLGLGRGPPDTCVDKYHVGGLFFDRGCGVEFSEYMKTWAGCVAAITAIYAAIQVRVLKIKPVLSSSFPD